MYGHDRALVAHRRLSRLALPLLLAHAGAITLGYAARDHLSPALGWLVEPVRLLGGAVPDMLTAFAGDGAAGRGRGDVGARGAPPGPARDLAPGAPDGLRRRRAVGPAPAVDGHRHRRAPADAGLVAGAVRRHGRRGAGVPGAGAAVALDPTRLVVQEVVQEGPGRGVGRRDRPRPGPDAGARRPVPAVAVPQPRPVGGRPPLVAVRRARTAPAAAHGARPRRPLPAARAVRPGTRVLVEGPYGAFTSERRTRHRCCWWPPASGSRRCARSPRRWPRPGTGPGDVTVLYRGNDEAAMVLTRRAGAHRGRHRHAGGAARRAAGRRFLAAAATWPARTRPPTPRRCVRLVPGLRRPRRVRVRAAGLDGARATVAARAGVPSDQVHDERFGW